MQGHRNQFRNAVAQIYVVGVKVKNPAILVILHNGGARRVQPVGVGITLCDGQVADDIHHDRIRRFKSEGSGVTNIEFEDAVAKRFHAVGFFENRSANIVEDVVQL